MIQENFNVTVELIRRQGRSFSFLERLLNAYDSTVLVFSFFNKPAPGNSREHILTTYELKAKLFRRNAAFMGYPLLLIGLRCTGHTHICVSVFIMEIGTFTIFSDFDREEIIGALFSPEAPEDAPVYSHLFMNGELLSRERE